MLIFASIILGLIFGSFVNAFVWRLKKHKNWVSDRSICTHCGHKLAAVDLIPVISWLQLRGRCRYCKKPIEDSPLVELSVAAAFGLSVAYWPYTLDTRGYAMLGFWLLSVVLMAAMFVYDLKWMILPNGLTFGLLGLGIIQLLVVFFFWDSNAEFIQRALFSTLLGGVVFHLIYVLSRGKYIGGGDVKFGYGYGLLLLNPVSAWLTITIASILGSVIAVILILLKRAKLSSKLPFGPMLIIGAFIAGLWGERIWGLISKL